jgi:hypothetical protein
MIIVIAAGRKWTPGDDWYLWNRVIFGFCLNWKIDLVRWSVFIWDQNRPSRPGRSAVCLVTQCPYGFWFVSNALCLSNENGKK